MSNPYKGIADYCYWSRAMTRPAPGHIDPVVKAGTIKPYEKISTMGSCFAQHISKHLAALGFNYFVPECSPPGMSDEEATALGYAVFSARYGNIYTVRQALQLFDRAFGLFSPEERAWPKAGGWCDPYRPGMFPKGFHSKDEVIAESEKHLGFVRKVFLESDWLVLTLGLTEAWGSKSDGAIFPIAPGVSGGVYEAHKYKFFNFSAADVISDFSLFCQKLLAINNNIKIIVTVSPVPLIATYEDRHVLVSTCYSKSVLRVAADEIERQFSAVQYFPSYEIITSPAACGRYYRSDLRQVTETGVGHVMRVLSKHYFDPGTIAANTPLNVQLSQSAPVDIICDEELIESALKLSGLSVPNREPTIQFPGSSLINLVYKG